MIIILMGVSGSGKTTVGQALASRHNCTFIDADDHHPPANIARMRRGEPLTDADRYPWLDNLNAQLRQAHAVSQPTVLACSALRQAYRDRLARELPPAALRWVFLQVSPQRIQQRMSQRADHFMPPSLMQSQFDALESPQASDDTIVIDADQPVADVLAAVESSLGLL
ncbi:gluconokinase [Phycisphaerales bacterium AB-hyl4]|uniref:Gluconokinase n=1 Tax=Natronomicrosphaera hydrolytica TaxID=3242702 RepID=A0ABV4UAD4_9BACT